MQLYYDIPRHSSETSRNIKVLRHTGWEFLVWTFTYGTANSGKWSFLCTVIDIGRLHNDTAVRESLITSCVACELELPFMSKRDNLCITTDGSTIQT
jgi:hypothetical protein